MPIDRLAYRTSYKALDFANVHCQLRDAEGCGPFRNVLIIGPGNGLSTAVFQWKGYDVLTLDIDPIFRPDIVSSVTDMSAISDQSFDIVVASHVLEHMPSAYLEASLSEISRVGRHALIYLPRCGRRIQLRLTTAGLGAIDRSLLLNLYKWWRWPSESTALWQDGNHFWEVGVRGLRVPDLVFRMQSRFEVLRVYRSVDWPYSQNFVLKSRYSARFSS